MPVSKTSRYIGHPLLAVLLGSHASAALAAQNLVNGNTIRKSDCSLLERPVTTRLSAGISGAWSCEPAIANIKLAICARYGNRAETIVPCRPVDMTPKGDLLYNNPECGSNPNAHVTVSGPKAYVGSFQFPSPVAMALNTSCDDATIAGISFLDQN